MVSLEGCAWMYMDGLNFVIFVYGMIPQVSGKDEEGFCLGKTEEVYLDFHTYNN